MVEAGCHKVPFTSYYEFEIMHKQNTKLFLSTGAYLYRVDASLGVSPVEIGTGSKHIPKHLALYKVVETSLYHI